MKTLRLILGVVVVFLILATGCKRTDFNQNLDQMVATAKQSVVAITVEQVKEKLDNGDMILLIDVREPNEFNAGYIPGAINIPRGVIEFKMNNEVFWDGAFLYLPLKDDEIIVYCKKGKRGTLAAETLKKLGYENVSFIEGGWKNWEMNYPLLYEKNLDAMGHDDGGESGGC
ncbi:MAG: rhodanese-like domain-containing protein [Bacteroidota bacterium]